ncbi:hypothetical protein [Flavobacterium sp. W21_SRS_FM6]|uniref:hypothetical protein n=1 Tax=Flavobacterium sp. W21_SRS_FM6 TaxID=3240268 RepID=UPI003F92089C
MNAISLNDLSTKAKATNVEASKSIALGILKSTYSKCHASYEKWIENNRQDYPWGNEQDFHSHVQIEHLSNLVAEVSSFPNITKEQIYSNALWFSWPDQEILLAPMFDSTAEFERLIRSLQDIYWEVNNNGSN